MEDLRAFPMLDLAIWPMFKSQFASVPSRYELYEYFYVQ
jgi:hypothetical protein